MRGLAGVIDRTLAQHDSLDTTGAATSCRCDKTWRHRIHHREHVRRAMVDAVEAHVEAAVASKNSRPRCRYSGLMYGGRHPRSCRGFPARGCDGFCFNHYPGLRMRVAK